jgi:drug/metabolite transporter (DMT)-like permease
MTEPDPDGTLSVATAEQWERVKRRIEQQALDQPHVTGCWATVAHWAPHGRHRHLWFAVLPLGDEIVPGARPHTTREGTARTEDGAKRAAQRALNEHSARMQGRDPNGPALASIHSLLILGAAINGMAAVLMFLGQTFTDTAVSTCLLAVAAIVMTVIRRRRARRFHYERFGLADDTDEDTP